LLVPIFKRNKANIFVTTTGFGEEFCFYGERCLTVYAGHATLF